MRCRSVFKVAGRGDVAEGPGVLGLRPHNPLPAPSPLGNLTAVIQQMCIASFYPYSCQLAQLSISKRALLLCILVPLVSLQLSPNKCALPVRTLPGWRTWRRRRSRASRLRHRWRSCMRPACGTRWVGTEGSRLQLQ